MSSATEWWEEFVLASPPRTGKLAVTRKDGSPHVAPVWVDVDGAGSDARLVFMTSAETVKGRSILRDGRVSLCFDDDRPPFSFVTVNGNATTTDDPATLLEWATRIGGRYMGADKAEAYGKRNAVPPELAVFVTPTRIVGARNVAD
ncbi:MAG: PPOX class F420-dependent oxidoreductase [Actinomycetota bacterium]